MSHADNGATNGHDEHVHAAPAKGKGKQNKKPVDSGEASKLVAARISQLEQEHAGEKDQEAEIEREVKRATRELNQQIAKLEPMEKKVDYLLKRCSEHLADLRRAQRDNKNNKTRADNLQKDKDANRAELSKNVGLKEKLEKLCRELQKDNNKLKSDLKSLQNAEKDRQVAWDHKYASVLAKLQDWQEDKDRPRQDAATTEVDELFRQRFKIFIEQYEIRELHYHSYMRTKELEVQYHLARADGEKKKADDESNKARNLQAQVQTFHKTETDLRQQLNVYIDKFKQVEDTLNNSNELFHSFRKEMEDMSKKTKKLEKENETLKRKHEATTSRILCMVDEREAWKKKADAAEQNVAKLKSIIQQMQSQGRRAPEPRTPLTMVALETSPRASGRGAGSGNGGGTNHQDNPSARNYDDVLDEDLLDGDEVLREVLAVDMAKTVGGAVAPKLASEPVPYGPERPPPPPPKAAPAVTNAISTPQVLLVPYEPLHVERYHEWMQDAALREATASDLLSPEEERENQQSWREARDKLTFILCRPLSPSSSSSLGQRIVTSGEEDAPGRMIGDINLFIHPDSDADDADAEANGISSYNAEIDIMLAEPSSRGKGVGKAAVCALLVFIQRHVNALMAEYTSDNKDHDNDEGNNNKTPTREATLRTLMVKIQERNERSVRLFESVGFGRTREGTNYFGEVELALEGWRERVVGLDWWEGVRGGYEEMEYRR